VSAPHAIHHALLRTGRLLAGRPGQVAWAVGAVAAALVAFAIVHLAARNVAAWSSSWQGGSSMVVYLASGVGDEQIATLGEELRAAGGVDRVEHVPSAEAARRLRAALGPKSELLEGVDARALPASLEITLAPGVRDVAAASPIVDALRASPAVEDVELTGEWVDEVGAVLAGLRGVAWSLGALLGALAVWIIAATLRLALHGLAAEARIARLLGAPTAFVRAPALLAGAVQGALGALVAIAGVWLVHRSAAADIASALGRVLGTVRIGFLPPAQLCLLVAAGALLGVLGGLLATGRRALA
jgi:cell division transport system permease protein